MFEQAICKRCKQKIIKGNEIFIPKLGTFCSHCAEVYVGDDDYIDSQTGEKLI